MDDPAHRRIELQSPEDLTYLIDNVRRAAADSINAAFPPVENSALDEHEDELRNRIEQLVNEYIHTTFTLAAPNLTINGLPVDPSPFLPSLSPTTSTSTPTPTPQQPQPQYVYEPFDPRKRDRIEHLISQEEDLLRSIASLKRRVPSATASRWAEANQAGIESDASQLQAACASAAADGAVSGRKVFEGMGGLERQRVVEERFRGVVEGLGRLKREMPGVVARMERARVAAGYVNGKGKGEEEGR